MVRRIRPVCRPGRLRDLWRKVAHRSQAVRPRREPALRGELSRTDLRRLRLDPAARREQPAVRRGSRSARPAKSPAQSGGRMEPVHARRGGTGRRLAGSTVQGGRGEHAGHTDREVCHSPSGRTPGAGEKLRQMVTASARAYRDGQDTTEASRGIVTTYLDSELFASRPGYGEIVGVPKALRLWYGTDLAEANRVLTTPATTKAQLARKAEVYRQVLTLLLAGRRPTYYLIEHHAALAALTDNYLRLSGAAGIIDAGLRDAALHAELHFRADLPPPAAMSFVGNKATDRIRDKLVSLLHLPDLYALDRLDLTGCATVDTPAQKRVTDVLTRLGDPAYVRSLGLVGHDLLGGENPARLTWSV